MNWLDFLLGGISGIVLVLVMALFAAVADYKDEHR